MRTANLRPFFGYYGGKWRDTPTYYPAPEFGVIVEPFAGSAGYSLRYADRAVILCERDPIVAGVWEFLINEATPEYIRGLPDIEPGQSVDDLGEPEAVRSLIGFWLNRGVSRPRKRPSRWMRDMIRPGSFWGARVRETIASQLRHIRHWEIHRVSYEKCPVRRRVTWFIDPPYQRAGRHYHFGADGIDYSALGEWCKARKGQVIVCEHRGADWLNFTEFDQLGHTKTTRKNRRSPEVWWYRPSANGHARGRS